jgi:hypothetical protein
MKKVIRLTESDLEKIVKKVLKEQSVSGAPNYGVIDWKSYNKPSPQQKVTNFKITSVKDKKNYEMFFDCVKKSPKKQILKTKSGYLVILIDGYYFYNNGRVKKPNNEMANYFCFKNGVKIKDVKGDKTYLETGVETKHEETSVFSGGIKGFLRKKAPNIAQLFFTRPLTDKDFTENQKQVLFDVIQNAINRGVNKNKGCVEYNDYSDEIKSKLDSGTGAGTIDTILGTLMDDKFRMATTLGRFCYELKPNGSYIVSDKYDFSKGKNYNVTLDELKGKSYPEQLSYVMVKSDSTPYRAARQIAYLEHPDTADESTKTPITVKIDSGWYSKKQYSNNNPSKKTGVV